MNMRVSQEWVDLYNARNRAVQTPPEAPAKPKMRSKRCRYDGKWFDSKREASRYSELKLLESAGEVAGIEHHKVYDLIVNGIKITSYEADFVYSSRAGTVVEDVKPDYKSEQSERAYKRTDAYRRFKMKKLLMLAIHGIDVREV